MAKAFDLTHKVNTTPKDEEGRVPFDDQPKGEEEKPKSRLRVEMGFFYGLLFVVFFVIGASIISPSFLAGLTKKSNTEASPSPSFGPKQGLVIDKEGLTTKEATPAAKVGATASPSANAVSTASPTVVPAATTPAKIQVLNGTNRTGGAASLRTKLAAADIVVASIGNYKNRNVAKTTIYFKPGFETTANSVQTIAGGITTQTSDGIGAYDVLVVIGTTN